jgi:hypothetical protein
MDRKQKKWVLKEERQKMNFRRVAGKDFRKQMQETDMLEEQETQQRMGLRNEAVLRAIYE